MGTYESVEPGVLPVQGLVDPDNPRGPLLQGYL
jgi:hypothetical protein